jgi:radical SAM superfamily enzyme with C-terminal helix-hairpin-helix motif
VKFRVTMKDPDTLYDAIREAVAKQVDGSSANDDEEREMLIESRTEKVGKLCRKWFGYGEYLTVEIDTDAKTCVVIPEGGAA